MRKWLLLLTMTIAAVCTMSAQKFTGKIGEFEVTLYADFSNASEGDYAGSSLFLPAAGCFKKEEYINGYSDGHVGFYWSSSLCELSSAYEFDIYPTNYVEWQERVLRYYGQSVRAVFTE